MTAPEAADPELLVALSRVLDEVFDGHLVGAYLHGSTGTRHLRARSDVDVLAVTSPVSVVLPS